MGVGVYGNDVMTPIKELRIRFKKKGKCNCEKYYNNKTDKNVTVMIIN